jgi:hypothetical protein
MNDNTIPARLADIASISINPALPKEEKISSFVRQANYSPYSLISGKFQIEAEFDSDAPALECTYKRFAKMTSSTILIEGAIIGGEKGKMNTVRPAP